jgi:hypothetical protein
LIFFKFSGRMSRWQQNSPKILHELKKNLKPILAEFLKV